MTDSPEHLRKFMPAIPRVPLPEGWEPPVRPAPAPAPMTAKQRRLERCKPRKMTAADLLRAFAIRARS